MLRRIIAGIIDLIFLFCVVFAPIILAAIWMPKYMDAPPGQPPTPLMGITLLWIIFPLLCYFPAFESSRLKATPGKFILRLKVVRGHDEQLSFMQAFYRITFGPLFLWFLPLYRHRMSGGTVVINR